MKSKSIVAIILLNILFISCKDPSSKQEDVQEDVQNKNIEAGQKKNINLDELKWLQGSWINEDKTTIETWAIQDDSLSGNVYSAVTKKITEVLSIKKVGQSWVYGARVLDQNEGNTIYFNLEDSSDGKLTFINPDHDYPNSLSYSKIDDKTINIWIAGKNGQSSTFKLFKLD